MRNAFTVAAAATAA